MSDAEKHAAQPDEGAPAPAQAHRTPASAPTQAGSLKEAAERAAAEEQANTIVLDNEKED